MLRSILAPILHLSLAATAEARLVPRAPASTTEITETAAREFALNLDPKLRINEWTDRNGCFTRNGDHIVSDSICARKSSSKPAPSSVCYNEDGNGS